MSEEKTESIFTDSNGNPTPESFTLFFLGQSVFIGAIFNSAIVGIIVYVVGMFIYGYKVGFFPSQKDEGDLN